MSQHEIYVTDRSLWEPQRRTLRFTGDTLAIQITESIFGKTSQIGITAEELAYLLQSCAGGFQERFNAELCRLEGMPDEPGDAAGW